MKRLTIKELRTYQPYQIIDRGRIINGETAVWIIVKLPNHKWTAYKGHPSLTERELAEYGKPILEDEVKGLIDCDEEALKRYEIVERG
jgi:hypothetical protein